MSVGYIHINLEWRLTNVLSDQVVLMCGSCGDRVGIWSVRTV